MVPRQQWLSRSWAEEPMTVCVSWPRPRTVAIRVYGEVDLCTAPRLEHELCQGIHGSVDAVLVDLSEVSFLAVAGLDCLLRAQSLADERGIPLYIDRGDSRVVNRVFSVLRDTLPAGFSVPVPRG
jgi:anti-sigma B factor antagonist